MSIPAVMPSGNRPSSMARRVAMATDSDCGCSTANSIVNAHIVHIGCPGLFVGSGGNDVEPQIKVVEQADKFRELLWIAGKLGFAFCHLLLHGRYAQHHIVQCGTG